jgi:hypothetical protein
MGTASVPRSVTRVMWLREELTRRNQRLRPTRTLIGTKGLLNCTKPSIITVLLDYYSWPAGFSFDDLIF